MIARSSALALAFLLATACGEPAKPSTTPEPAASAAAPLECPSKGPDGGVTCPTGCEQVGEKCLKPKGIIAPH